MILVAFLSLELVYWNRWEKALVLKDLTADSHFVPVLPMLLLIFHADRRLVQSLTSHHHVPRNRITAITGTSDAPHEAVESLLGIGGV